MSSSTFQLASLGWDSRFAESFIEIAPPGAVAARVIADHGASYLVHDGACAQRAMARHVDPAVGDWVTLAGGEIRGIVERRTVFSRRAAGNENRRQVLAANVDVAFLVTSLNAEFNLRRLERYVAVAWDSGAVPVVLLSKADLAADVEGMRLAAEATAPGVEVIAASAVTGDGLDAVRRHLGTGRTVVFLGSSGVGKSSLVNALAGAPLLATATIREDDARGRHTTTRRQLVRLEEGLVIDTPGLRELGLADGDGLGETFGDVEAIARECRFRDCSHEREPGCAVRAALAGGRLDAERFDAYRKLEREAHRAELAGNAMARKAERRRWTALIRGVERGMAMKYGSDR